MKMVDIHSADFKIVEKKKIWFCIPAVVLAIAIICGIIFGFADRGNVLNLGMEFTGGYSLTIKLGSELDDADVRAEDEKRITYIIEHPADYAAEHEGLSALVPGSEAPIEGLRVRSISKQGVGEDQALRVSFTSDYTQADMGDTNTEDGKGIIVALVKLLDYEFFDSDPYGGSITEGGSVSASVSSELLITAICGVIMALALMLIYIAIRFELLSGFIALLCLVHDIAIMFLFMLIFHIPITSTFIAALITILGYSINNTIIIFDKVRDNVKTMPEGTAANDIANTSVRDTMVRSINTTLTTFIMVFMVWMMSAIFGVADLVNFCLPLMAGLIAGAFSSVFLAPSMWAAWKNRSSKKAKAGNDKGVTVSDETKSDDDLFGDISYDNGDGSEKTDAPDDELNDKPESAGKTVKSNGEAPSENDKVSD